MFYAERQNLNVRMHTLPTRLTNAPSKNLQNHAHAAPDGNYIALGRGFEKQLVVKATVFVGQ
jgi:hypothetical protein